MCGVGQELIVGIQVSVLTVFPEAHPRGQLSSVLLVLCLVTASLQPQRFSSLISDLPSQIHTDHGMPNLSAASLPVTVRSSPDRFRETQNFARERCGQTCLKWRFVLMV